MLHRAVWEGLPQRNQRTAWRAYREQLIEFALRTGEKPTPQGDLFPQERTDLPLLSQLLPPDREMVEWLAQRCSDTGRRLLEMLAAEVWASMGFALAVPRSF